MRENKQCAAEDKTWGKFCHECCRIKESCLLGLVKETECPVTTQIMELDYVKK